MRTPPPELTGASIVVELTEGWRVDAESVDYLDVGFGSHHWRADGADGRWFVTVDDLDTKLWSGGDSRDAAFDRLCAALQTARALHDGGLGFVVAPVPTDDGAVVRRIDDRFALTLHPHVDGRAPGWGDYESRADRLAVLDLIVAVHDGPPAARSVARADDFVVPERDALERAVDDVSRPWDTGPYAERTRALLSRHALGVERLLARHDWLAHGARRRTERVVTHGEPHPGNTMLTEAGWLLVDWDTVLLAPPERDLWMLAEGDRVVIDRYITMSGRPVSESTLELYRIGWDLSDIARFVAGFRRPHTATADAELAWLCLERGLPQTDDASEPGASEPGASEPGA